MERGQSAPVGVTLYEVVSRFESDGWTGQFQARDGGVLRCLTCREEFPASIEHADEVARVEGVSDPDDMVAVVPLRCPHCGVRGTFVAHYGPGAGAEESDALVAFERGGPAERPASPPAPE
jgi:DNA-directed RNA polymerase subunit RPC12/RpoP